jgi:hypothetical protein
MTVIAAQYQRTEVPYPTYGPPETGQSWHEYFVELAALRRGDVVETIDEDGIRYVSAAKFSDGETEPAPEAKIEVVVPAHSLDVAGSASAPNALMAYHKLLLTNGWRAQLAHCQSLERGTPYGPTAQKAGQMRDDKVRDLYWVSGYKADKGIVKISYHVVNNKTSSCELRSINRRLELVSDVQMKDWIKSD